MTNITGRLFSSLLPAPFTTGFDSAAAGTATALIGAIACGTFSWTGRIVVHTGLRTYQSPTGGQSSREFQRPRQERSVTSTRDALNQPTSTVPASRGGQSSASTTTA